MDHFCGVVKNSQENSTTETFMSEMDAEILLYTQPSNMMPKKHAGAIWNKTLGIDRDHDEYMFKGIFIERLHGLASLSIHSY